MIGVVEKEPTPDKYPFELCRVAAIDKPMDRLCGQKVHGGRGIAVLQERAVRRHPPRQLDRPGPREDLLESFEKSEHLLTTRALVPSRIARGEIKPKAAPHTIRRKRRMAEPAEIELGLESAAPLIHDEPAVGVHVPDIGIEERRLVGAGVLAGSRDQAAGVRGVECLEECTHFRPEREASFTCRTRLEQPELPRAKSGRGGLPTRWRFMALLSD